MAFPPFAEIETNYTAFQQGQGGNLFPGQQVDADLANLKHAVDTLNSFVRGITRTDGEVGNQTIGRDQLKPELAVGLPQPVTWAAATSYAAGDTVFSGLGFYRATAAHTSSASFDADFATGYWEQLIDFESSLSESLPDLVGPLVQAEVPGITEDVLAQVPAAVTAALGDELPGLVEPIVEGLIPGITEDVLGDVPGVVNPLIAAAVASPFGLEADSPQLRFHETDAEGDGAGRFRFAGLGAGGFYLQGTTTEDWSSQFNIWRYQGSVFQVTPNASFDGNVTITGDLTAATYTAKQRTWLSPLMYGAVGDGTTNDATNYASAQSAATALFLPDGKTFKIGPTAPTKRVTGPGSLLFTDGSSNSATVGGFDLTFDAIKSNVALVPEIWVEKAIGFTSSPSGTNYFNVAIAPGSNVFDGTAIAWRSLLLGHAAGQSIKSWERTEAVGNGAMRFAQYSDRNTAIGSLALQWIGATSRQHLIDTAHDFWRSDVGVPGTPPWDFGGLETRNSGIGADIQAWNSYATDATAVYMNVAVGRDSLLHIVRGFENTGIGYQSLTNLFDGNYNTAVGTRSLRDNVFGIGNTAIGRSAGFVHQEGSNNVFVGREAGRVLVKGSNNIFLGYRAGDLLATEHSDLLVIGSGVDQQPAMVADMANRKFVIGVNIGTDVSLSEISALPGVCYYNIIDSALPSASGRFAGSVTSGTATLVSTVGTSVTASRTHAVFEYADGTVLGSITSASGNVAFNTSSDSRVKIERGYEESALDKICTVPVRRYSRAGSEDAEEVGFFAHELQAVAPWAVTGEPNAVDAFGQPILQLVDYGKTTPLLWAALVEMKGRLDALEARKK